MMASLVERMAKFWVLPYIAFDSYCSFVWSVLSKAEATGCTASTAACCRGPVR